ncbi:hypothetical protein CMQ_3487 [Grosmannia clavigera kw1407]|uniref:Uncharacterized protein n=1 Tax=Grosmannia clavigera (strain kw1407 / UAMH 11150) TaxID=655863 RepID=F0X9Q3_GROCL|nr:uncharacterized protein CMQ_3487 [Grosmannia clavigera kw1407]EFX05418.1 hypothetical protein CMQ_3487 [Grosmannia clavigera kw1407]
MTSTLSSAAAATTTPCAGLYTLPTYNANCAMPYGGNHTEIMTKCCKNADVVSYHDSCGLYCLAVDQTIQDLYLCLYANGAKYSEVFCSNDNNATASGDISSIPTGYQASVVVGTQTDTITSHTGTTHTGTTGKTTTSTATSDATKTASSSSGSSSSKSAASETRPLAIVNTLGLAISALLVSAVAFGVQQI